ncbi:MAG: FecR domain-containing protein [Bacteroidetes bacterium]|nr:FecR domain-containing protein [Bacteroidota bacterium]
MNDFLSRYLKNECSEKDFDSVVNLMLSQEKKGELEQLMRKHWAETPNEGPIPDFTNVLYRIHYLINKSEKEERKRVTFFQYFSRVAALFLLPLMIALGYQLVNNQPKNTRTQTVSTPLASHTSFNLPDGSKVWLNAGSTITFPELFDQKQRSVKLIGQAYFDVKKDKVPFCVETNQFTVKVLGTSFDVLAYPGEEASVTLERGKVSLETSSGNEAVLNPGQQAVIENGSGRIEQRDVDTGQFVAWKNNRLIFVEEPLEKVAIRLKRWFNVDITIEGESIKKIPVNGIIEYESIGEVMQLLEICAPVKCSYNKKERKIILKQR